MHAERAYDKLHAVIVAMESVGDPQYGQLTTSPPHRLKVLLGNWVLQENSYHR